MFEPNPQIPFTRKSRRQVIRSASTYAHFSQNQPLYLNKAVGTPLSAYEWALADYLGKPEVLHIDIRQWTGRAGQPIRIQARDNLMVMRVYVKIWDGILLLEEGEARQCQDERLVWIYTTRTDLPVQPGVWLDVVAYDLPGNTGANFLVVK